MTLLERATMSASAIAASARCSMASRFAVDAGRQHRPRRRIRLGQDHAAAPAARPRPGRAAARISFDGAAARPAQPAASCATTGAQVQAVFQDPYSSLDPRQTVLAHHLRAAALAAHPRRRTASWWRLRSTSVGLDRPMPSTAIRTNSRAASASASPSPAPSSPGRNCCSPTRRSARSTCPPASASSTCSSASRQSMTLVFVSHDLGVVAALCEEIVILERGRIVEAGKTREILDAPAASLYANAPRRACRACPP